MASLKVLAAGLLAAGGLVAFAHYLAGLGKDVTVPYYPPLPGVARALSQLIGQLNAQFPQRSKAGDGTLPSAAHHAANPSSDHERGDALDVTQDPVNGPNLDTLAAALLKDARVTYVIWNRQIANRAIDGGKWRPYELTAIQTDPHTGHLHVSVSNAARDNAAPWDLSTVQTAAAA